MRLLINYGSHHQYQCLVPAERLGIVNGELVRGFTYTSTGYVFGTRLDNAEVVSIFEN